MVFGRKAKARKAIARALASVREDGDLADHAPIEQLSDDLRASAYYTLVQELVDDERFAAAKHALSRALELAPDEPELHALAATIHRELRDLTHAIAAQRRVVAARPRDVAAALSLAELLIATEQLDDAVALLRGFAHEADREIDTRLAEALFVRGDTQEAFAILDRVCGQYEAQLREPWSVPDRQGLIARAGHARRLRDDVYAELHGREATIELAAADGRLDARAGVNYRLLGARLASTGTRVAEVLELQDPATTEARGRDYGPADARGLALVGSAQLRRGELAAARKSFDRACETDGRCAAAFLGIGAVLDHDKYDLHRRAERLRTAPAASREVLAVVPDWPALTELEQRVVWASIGPFAAVLPVLAERGVTIRVLPIDVRATDVGLFEHIAGKRAKDDHRSYDALAGVATMRGAIAKVENLLDIASDHSWTFAHELAHLVYFHLDEARTAPFAAIYDEARRIGYATTTYALKNDDELFAVSFTEFLQRRHGGGRERIADDAGVQSALMSYFTALCQ